MYSPMEIDNIDYELKPMNCPFHIMIYKSDIRSYRDLPIRYAELGRFTAMSVQGFCTDFSG